MRKDAFYKDFKWLTHPKMPCPDAGGISFYLLQFIAKPQEKRKTI